MTDGGALIDPAGGPDEARIVALGEPVEGADPLFVGSLAAAVEEVMSHPAAWQAEVCIWTEGRIYGAADFPDLARRLGAAG